MKHEWLFFLDSVISHSAVLNPNLAAILLIVCFI